MARTLTIEMTDKQYVTLVFRMLRDGAPSPETMLAVPPIVHEKMEANTSDGIKVYETLTAPTPRFAYALLRIECAREGGDACDLRPGC